MENNAPRSNDSLNLVYFLIKWRKPLIIVGLSSIVLAIIFSGPTFIKPKFKSTSVFFPTTTNSVSKALLGQGKEDILEFGEEERAEQLIQLLNSDEIRNRIIRKYNLMKHYDIDSTDDYPQTKLAEKYNDNITFERTEFMSVKVEVMDTDPQIASDIANEVTALVDSVKNRMQHERAVEGLRIVAQEYEAKNRQVIRMEDSLSRIRKLGVLDYESQAMALQDANLKALAKLSEQKGIYEGLSGMKKGDDTATVMAKARATAAQKNMAATDQKVSTFANYSGAFLSLTEQLKLERENLSLLREKYNEAKVDATEKLSHKFIVNQAFKAEKKSYPIRWLIILAVFAGSMMSCVLIILFVENYKYFQSNKPTSASLE